jgi:hypothetical protein
MSVTIWDRWPFTWVWQAICLLGFIVLMMFGAVFMLVLFATRLLAIAAAIGGGAFLLSTMLSWGAWSHTHSLVHWHALNRSAGAFALCLIVTGVAGFWPMLLAAGPGPVATPARRLARPAR